MKELRDYIPSTVVKKLEKQNIITSTDVVEMIPKKYVDLTHPITLSSAIEGEKSVIRVRVQSVRNNLQNDYIRLSGIDDEDTPISATWFRQMYLFSSLSALSGKTVILYGKLTHHPDFGWQTSQVEYIDLESPSKKIYTIRKKISGISNQMMEEIISESIDYEEEKLPRAVRIHAGLTSISELLKELHFPSDISEANNGVRQEATRTLIDFAYHLKKLYPQKGEGIKIPDCDLERQYIRMLPYELTPDQKKTITAIDESVKEGKRLRLLVQGDVGCGKTSVAFALLMRTAGCGLQAVLIAPTSVLAKQHKDALEELIRRMSLPAETLAYLSAEGTATEKKGIKKRIKEGTAKIIVGTHAILAADVEFKKLAAIVVDEEHKFGVNQREILKEKAGDKVHVVSMSATPIPRSLATVIYGDSCDVVSIKTMPAGRLPVKTFLTDNKEKSMVSLKKYLETGGQAYVICPRVESDEKTEKESVTEAVALYEKFVAPYKVAALHGKMKKQEIKETIEAFAEGKIHVLISTTVVEVGVNVPNANYMVIEDADMFGLASLHQLRGRVGRGKSQGYCVLLSKDKEKERLNVMTRTIDGFEIADEDLRLRGAGNLIGTEQSGFTREITLMINNPELYRKAADSAQYALDKGLVL